PDRNRLPSGRRRALRWLALRGSHLGDVFGLSSLPAYVGALRLLRLCIGPVDAVKKECDWHAERLADTVKSGGTHAGFGLFVLVYLLKRDAQGRGKFLLTYAQFDAPLSDAHRYVNIDWFRPNLPLATGRFCPHATFSFAPGLSAFRPLRLLRLQPRLG